MTDFCDPMMKLMPAEMSQVSTPDRTRWAAAGSADATTSASAACPDGMTQHMDAPLFDRTSPIGVAPHQ
jgi:hypothetical protein